MCTHPVPATVSFITRRPKSQPETWCAGLLCMSYTRSSRSRATDCIHRRLRTIAGEYMLRARRQDYERRCTVSTHSNLAICEDDSSARRAMRACRGQAPRHVCTLQSIATESSVTMAPTHHARPSALDSRSAQSSPSPLLLGLGV
ncbi:hypothetical protein L226DRAFT_255272 [Lentinus tigrinus ALCF2SS1-7]|uniref:uncharacterized protein n=1 Tax=Lentinus tigrinus ALCF2SS1-7 TaxID=1328758 RepID=UPI001165DFEC|nr:hypothetical protein L226DRAFT_255272 [Lentinus tigrinus ALCF2SS1-7]